MNSHPKVSVILTSYNHAKYLREAIDSVLNQTFSDFELIIWDDHSLDESWDIINQYNDPRIIAYRNDEQKRGIFNINKAITEVCQGEYVAIHHSDDVWESDKLEKQVALLDSQPEVGAVFTWAQVIDDNGINLPQDWFIQENKSQWQWLRQFFQGENHLCHPSVLIRKICFQEVGLYRFGLVQTGDMEMWIRLLLKYPIRVIQERLTKHRLRSDQTNTSSSRPDTRIRMQFELYKLIQNYREMASFDNLVEIFPSAKKYDRKEETDNDFALAMVALEEGALSHTQLFGLDILFEIISDRKRSVKIKDLYDFDYKTFVSLAGKHDVFSQEVISMMHGVVADRDVIIASNNEAIRDLRRQLISIKSSIAWAMALRMQKAALFFLPLESKRRRAVGSLINGFRIWHNDGLRVLLRKAFLNIKRNISSYFYRLLSTIKPASIQADPYVPINDWDVDPSEVLVKTIALYLPQFHPIPENDAWWGEGFTEWTNVLKARPNFDGHYQPRLPGELGYYDLREPEVQKRQVELAKKYGIYGFCFYYYWFAGKRLLERPLDQYLANSSLDFPFCLCWANENWTRRWDGAEHEVLIEQTHNEKEYLHFIQDISSNFVDPRYIRIDGKPILLVYRINLLPDPQKAADIWRDECRRLGLGEIYLMAVQSFGITDPRPYGFDAAVEFPPHRLGEAEINKYSLKVRNSDFKGKLLDYRAAAKIMMQKNTIDYTLFKTVMLAWDNTARRQDEAHVFINATPSVYKKWLENVVSYTRKNFPKDKRFVFINAWNEWAEGTYLEPDHVHGYAYLQATAEAIQETKKLKFPFPPGWKILFISHDAHQGGAQIALLSTLEWFKQHTSLSFKVLCLDGGVLLPRFQALADTIVLNELENSLNGNVMELRSRLLDFCGWEPDLIYGNTVVSGKIYSWLHTLNVPIITHVYELEMSIQRYAADCMKDVLSYSTQYIVPSTAVKDNLIKNHSVDADKIAVVFGSVPNEILFSYKSDKEKKQKRKRLKLDIEKKIIVGCGLGMPFRKGADIFIKVGDILRRKGLTNFHFYWIGDFADSESDPLLGSWSEHKEKLAKNNLGDFVTFLGYKENFKEYFQVADIFVLPSREDPLPLVAIEAAKFGLPLVCFADAGGTPDLVGDDAGFVVAFEDIEAMAEKIIKLMDDATLRMTLGKRAREKFLSKFTMERTTPNLFSICREVAGKKPAVSVIVPNYNHAKYLPERLDSIFNQTFQDFEVILLDDASTDSSMEILQQFADYGTVQIHKNEKNSGSPFKQWIVGLGLAKADILWIAESDDVAKPEFLETMLPAFRDPAVKIAYANSDIIDQASRIVGDYSSDKATYLAALSSTKWKSSYITNAHREINDALGVKNSILNASAVLLRKFDLSPGMKEALEKMKIAGDWYFYVHAIKDGKVYFDFRKLNSHRRHLKSLIAQTVSENKMKEFFHEFSLVHRYIFNTYQIEAGFTEKWEEYLYQQLHSFSPGSSYDILQQYYPLADMRNLIAKAQSSHNS